MRVCVSRVSCRRCLLQERQGRLWGYCASLQPDRRRQRWQSRQDWERWGWYSVLRVYIASWLYAADGMSDDWLHLKWWPICGNWVICCSWINTALTLGNGNHFTAQLIVACLCHQHIRNWSPLTFHLTWFDGVCLPSAYLLNLSSCRVVGLDCVLREEVGWQLIGRQCILTKVIGLDSVACTFILAALIQNILTFTCRLDWCRPQNGIAWLVCSLGCNVITVDRSI